jgi:hypothetical protein
VISRKQATLRVYPRGVDMQVTSQTQSWIRLVLWTVLFLALLIAILVEFHWTRLLLLLVTGGGALTELRSVRSDPGRSG